jgi:hypothetical protein
MTSDAHSAPSLARPGASSMSSRPQPRAKATKSQGARAIPRAYGDPGEMARGRSLKETS